MGNFSWAAYRSDGSRPVEDDLEGSTLYPCDVMDELYAVGWRTPGRPRRWVMAVYPSVAAAAAAGGGYARFDGGGRWRVYTTRVVSADRTTRVVRDRIVAEGLALRQRLPRLPRPQPLGVRERPLQPVAGRRVRQVVERELVCPADAVRPVRADPEPHHVGDDQQRRVLERQRVLPELAEGRVEVRALPLVLPGEVVPLPDVGPAVAARVLARARSKQYVSPVGSASAGVGSPSSRHRSRKCSCDAERSFSSKARHFVMKACGVTASMLRPRP